MSKVRTEVTFVERNGRTLSQRKEFNEGGTLVREGLYSKAFGSWGWDIPIGAILSFNDNGTLKCEEHFDESGVRSGECKFYSRQGELEKIVTYVNGKIEKEEIKKAP